MTATASAMRTALAWDVDETARVDREGVDLLLVAGQPITVPEEAMRDARVEHHRREDVSLAEVPACIEDGLALLGLDVPGLAEDMVCVARSFFVQFGLSSAGVRIDVVDRTTCPAFHTDCVRLRLVRTYYGPTTEYIHRGATDEIHQAPADALVFLKGCKHPTCSDSVLHRSPAVPCGHKRLCLVLDW